MPMTMVVLLQPTTPVSAARPKVDGSAKRHVRDAPAVLRPSAIDCYALDYCCCHCCCCYYYCCRYPVGPGSADSVLVSDYSRDVEASEHFAGLLPVT
uniref:Putative secreted protein n=1 Tax=Anopheles darlingi TaxID=43151 RepID=A0A2M4D7T0_ANODA